jgi:hypothetical protein
MGLTLALSLALNNPLSILGPGGPALKTLGLSPSSASALIAYTGTISNATAGSVITATSSDGTVLTVTGSGTTRTVTGTFKFDGTPTINLTETLAGYGNSPNITLITGFSVGGMFALQFNYTVNSGYLPVIGV